MWSLLWSLLLLLLLLFFGDKWSWFWTFNKCASMNHWSWNVMPQIECAGHQPATVTAVFTCPVLKNTVHFFVLFLSFSVSLCYVCFFFFFSLSFFFPLWMKSWSSIIRVRWPYWLKNLRISKNIVFGVSFVFCEDWTGKSCLDSIVDDMQDWRVKTVLCAVFFTHLSSLKQSEHCSVCSIFNTLVTIQALCLINVYLMQCFMCCRLTIKCWPERGLMETTCSSSTLNQEQLPSSGLRVSVLIFLFSVCVVYGCAVCVCCVWLCCLCVLCMALLSVCVVYGCAVCVCCVWLCCLCVLCMAVLSVCVVYGSAVCVCCVWLCCLCVLCMAVLSVCVVYGSAVCVCCVWLCCNVLHCFLSSLCVLCMAVL